MSEPSDDASASETAEPAAAPGAEATATPSTDSARAPRTKARRSPRAGRPAEAPLLFFVHIPKAAGTTLAPVLEAQYPEGGVVKTANMFKGSGGYDPDALESLRTSAGILAGAGVLRGHLPYGARELLPPGTCCITLLREPVDRLLSHYFSLVGEGDIDPAIPLDVALSDRRIFVDNLQTRMLCGALEPFGEVTGDMLARAKSNLASEILFGLADRFDESLVLFKQRLGWRGVLYHRRRVNSSRPRPEEVPAEAVRAATRANAYDLELYRFARELFDRHVAQQGLEFAVDLAALRVASGAALDEQTPPGELTADHSLWRMLVSARAALTVSERETAAERATASLARAEVQRLHLLIDDAQRVLEHLGERAAAVRERLAAKSQRVSRPAARDGSRRLAQKLSTGRKRRVKADERPAAPPPDDPANGAEQELEPAARGGAKTAATVQAREWLDRELPEGATRPAQALTEAATAAGLDERSLRRARKVLAVRVVPHGDGDWLWTRRAADQLPAQPPAASST